MIDSSAIIHPSAKIGNHVAIGPHSIIGEHVTIGDGTEIQANVVISGRVTLGQNNRIFPFCALGGEPQDKKYHQEPTELVIGDGNTIREFCTLNLGTEQGGGLTQVGHDNWIMAYVHIAHDCKIGNHAIFANSTNLAGHVEIGDYAILGGFTGVHQFVHVGSHSFCGVGTVLLQDLPPYVTVAGNPSKPYGINSEGLKRRQFTVEQIAQIKQIYRLLYRSQLMLKDAVEQISAMTMNPEIVAEVISFIQHSSRGLVR